VFRQVDGLVQGPWRDKLVRGIAVLQCLKPVADVSTEFADRDAAERVGDCDSSRRISGLQQQHGSLPP
jgi:hypothetical protein